MAGYRVLVVDERRMLATGLALILQAHPAITEAHTVPDLSSLPEAVHGGWDVIVTSEKLAGQVLRLAPSSSRVLVVVQEADVPSLARLLRAGAAGACTLSDLPEDVAAAVEQVGRGELRLPGHLLHQVLAELQEQRERTQRATEVLAQLTQRERDVLFGLGRGRGRAQIADDLGLSPHTVRTHVEHLLRKLNLHSQLEAAAFARDLIATLTPPVLDQLPVVIDLDRWTDRSRTGPRTRPP